MDHGTLQSKLSAYLDGALTPEDEKAVAAHLGACRECKKILAAMAATRRHIQSLGAAEPPPWLTGKIMARVREEAEKKNSIFQRLFYPLHMKLSVQAVGLIFLTVMVYYIVREIQPGLKYFPASTEKTYEGAGRPKTPETAAPLKSPEEGKEIYKKAETPSAAEKAAEPAPPAERAASLTSSVPKPATPAQMARKEAAAPESQAGQRAKLAEVAAKPAKRSDMAEKMTAAPATAPQEAKPLEEAVPGEEKRKSAPRVLTRKGSAHDAEALHITLQAKEPIAAGIRLEETVNRLGGTIIQKESLVNGQVISAQVAGRKVGDLLAILKQLGEVREKMLPPKEAPDDQIIVIKILPTPALP
jgi:hypothetical protein